MRAQGVRRVLAASAAGLVMAGGAAIGAAGTAAAAPAVHTRVTTDRCFDGDGRGCFDQRDSCFHHRWFCFDHGNDRFNRFNRFDGFDRFDGGGTVIIVVR
ncbi:hypothetical protein [Streptomyces lucensis]|nr:hypothetical protein [Streptomyces lucensis]